MRGSQGNGLETPRKSVLGRHATAKLATGIVAAALLVPAAAAGRPAVAGYVAAGGAAASTDAGQGGSPDRSGALVLRRDGSKAVPFVADVGAGAATTASADGFDWGDAMIGAGAVLGIAALGGAGLTLRRRTAVGAGSVAAGS